VGLSVALVLACAGSVAAQNPSPSNSASPAVQAPPSPDFMIGRPRVMIGMRGNWNVATAGSDIYDFITDQLTIEKSGFNMPTLGAEFGINITPRLDIVFGVEGGRSSNQSEYRDKVEQVGTQLLPIQQTTTLRQLNISGAIRFAVLPKGRSVSRYAWIPRTVTPYVGIGGGMVQYNLEQIGDFVDFQDDHIFTDNFFSSAWAPMFLGFGGADIQLYRHLYMSIEGKYIKASAPLEQKFIGFDPIDLSGFRFGGGIHVVF
jgi:hypothetical protein